MKARKALIGQWPSRGDVARLLNITKSTVRGLEGRAITPVRDASGTVRFDPKEVRALIQRRGVAAPDPHGHVPGAICSRIFQLFQERKSIDEIVVLTQQTPQTVRALYVEFQTPLGQESRAAREARKAEDERRAQAEHDEMIREWDRRMEERRRINS